MRWWHLTTMPPGCFLGVLLAGGFRADPGHAREIMSLSWPGNAAVSLPRRAEGGGWSLLTLLPLKPSQ